MSAYLLADQAEADLRDIFRYTYRRWGFDQARAYQSDLIACMEAMAGGSVRSQRVTVAGLSCLRHRCRRHNLVALVRSGGLLIIAIFHERMNIEARIAGRLESGQ